MIISKLVYDILIKKCHVSILKDALNLINLKA